MVNLFVVFFLFCLPYKKEKKRNGSTSRDFVCPGLATKEFISAKFGMTTIMIKRCASILHFSFP
jgi:hypothetical protein